MSTIKRDKTNMELKKIAQIALGREYGFYPMMKDITLLEASGDGTYIRFKVLLHEYVFETRLLCAGYVEYGPGTIEKVS